MHKRAPDQKLFIGNKRLGFSCIAGKLTIIEFGGLPSKCILYGGKLWW